MKKSMNISLNNYARQPLFYSDHELTKDMGNFRCSEEAFQQDPVVAEMRGNYLKVIFSSGMLKTGWKITRSINRKVVEEIEKLKAMKGKDFFIFGSSVLSKHLIQHPLIDKFRLR